MKRRHGKVSVVPNNNEKYITFTIGDVVFKDSYAFTQASLDSLVDNLKIDQLKSTRRWLENSVKWTIYDEHHEDEEEEEEDFEDIMFIDDRPIEEAGSSSTRRRGRYTIYADNDEPISTLEQDTIFTERNQRQRMPRRIDDDYAIRGAEEQQQDITLPDDTYDEEDYLLNNDQGMPEYINDMADFDYRFNPPTPTILTEEENQLVNIDLQLLKQKGIYPYEYMDSFERFNEPTLPPIEAFNSTLKGEGISKADYARAKNIFEHFEMKTLQDFHNLYLLQDVLLLDDVLLAFREVCQKTYGLDPCHYYTAPGLTWDAGLKYTGVSLDLLTDQDMFMFVEDGIRGGISMITHRYAKANHPDLEDIGYYDKNNPLCNLLYLDANNLYGWAMMQHLPVGDFKWLTQDDIQRSMTPEKIGCIPEDSERGFILEVDMHLPDELHEYMSDYPVAPEKKSISGAQLSQYQRDILRDEIRKKGIMKNGTPPCEENMEQKMDDYEPKSKYARIMKDGTPEENLEQKMDAYNSFDKLILDYQPKMKYAIHYRNLQLYMQLGMKVTKIHRILSFEQKPWLASYIKANTEMRAKATNDFEKDFFKLMNNSFFGKTMENVRMRRHIDIVNNDPEHLNRLTAKPTYKSHVEITDDICAVERIKATVMLNKPIYLGLCVLDLSKVLMFDFYYNKLKKLFPNVKLLFTDTDSLCVSIEGCNDVYARIREGSIIGLDNISRRAIDEFDVSAYTSEHPLFNGMTQQEIKSMKSKNKKVPGKMKDELDGNTLLEFIGLRAKSYALRQLINYENIGKNWDEGEVLEVKKLKGIQKSVVKKNINFENYYECLFEKREHYADTTSIRSFKHCIKTLSARKSALVPFDDKRYLLQDGITSLPFGHILIGQEHYV